MWSIWTLLKHLLAFALLEITAAKGSAAWRKQRRSKSTMSGTVLLERTSHHSYLPSAELKDGEAMALVDPPSIARRASTMLCVPACNPSSEVTDNSTASVIPNSPVCDDEQLSEIFVPDLNHLEEPLPISGDHVPPDQVERVNHEDELSLEGGEDEAPSKVCMQQNTASMDTAQLNNIQGHSDYQSDNAST